MKRLIIMRHAKSDWSGGAASDHDRMLNKRGRLAAAALGQWIAAENLIPDEVVCSSAARTRQTLVGLDLPKDTTANTTRDLYLASADQIFATIQRAVGDCVLVIGHNPGIGTFAEAIVAAAPDHPQFRMYPTGATLVTDMHIDAWQDLQWANANARHFTVPRDL